MCTQRDICNYENMLCPRSNASVHAHGRAHVTGRSRDILPKNIRRESKPVTAIYWLVSS